MGNCFKSCLPESDTSRALRSFNILNNQNDEVSFTFLVEDNISTSDDNKRSFLSRFFKKRNDKKKPVLELVDGLLNPQLNSYSRLSESQRLSSTGSCTSHDIQLQCLDARALLQRTATSTPASSIDLEWEHETLPVSIINDPSGSSWTAIPEDISQCPSTTSPQNTAPAPNSDSDWSRVSSANSLEWDNVQNSIRASPPLSEVDTDTQFLLSEIERLTNKTLQETGQDLFS
ncbi:uncharacterized protein LOC108905596 [Anoplophora glabripennis]|uniref:uncharacterized protein LOC108905596 n=1 Tax=Anoplophora glabripennis TaxID=217634 RepID=UPI0008759641|nr:uncharacterized protein LOC108905596 [Anoplophora glabripennis]